MNFGPSCLTVIVILELVAIILALIGGMSFTGAKSLYWVGLPTKDSTGASHVVVWYSMFTRCYEVNATASKCTPLVPPTPKEPLKHLTYHAFNASTLTGFPAPVITGMPYFHGVSAGLVFLSLFGSCCTCLKVGFYAFLTLIIFLVQTSASMVAIIFFVVLRESLKGKYAFGPGLYATCGALALSLIVMLWSFCTFSCQRRQVVVDDDDDLSYQEKVRREGNCVTCCSWC